MRSAVDSDRARLRTRLLAAAVGASPVAVFTVDGSGSIAFAEGGALTGLSGGEVHVEGRLASDVWRSSPRLVDAIGQALAGIRFAEELWIDDRAFAVRLIPMHDRQGVVTGVAGLAVAVARSARSGAAEDTGELLAAVVAGLPLSVWVLDQRGDLVCDNSLAREHGLGAVRSAREEVSPGGSLVGRVLLDGCETDGKAATHDSYGERVDVKVRGIPLRNAKGSTLGALLLAEPPLPPPAPPSLVDLNVAPTTLSPFPWVLSPVTAAEAEIFA